MDRRRPGAGPMAWLSLDTDDTDRRRFWRAVLEALAARDGRRRGRRPGREPTRADEDGARAAGARRRARRAREPVVLVLDDFHEVIDARHEDLERLVRYPPPPLRLVDRHPRRPADRARAPAPRRQLTEIRAADLAFTLEEAGALFDALGIAVAPADVASALAAHRGLGRRRCVWQRCRCSTTPSRTTSSSTSPARTPTISDYLVSEVLAASRRTCATSCCARRSSTR